MPTFAERIEDEERRQRDRQRGSGLGTDIMNEMIKSYGFSRSGYGEWGWSVDTIAKSFKDDPIWTALDWLVVGVPVASWGKAIRAVKGGAEAATVIGGAGPEVLKQAAEGLRVGSKLERNLRRGGVAGKALAGGEFAEGAQTRAGRFLGRWVGQDVARAAEVWKAGPSRLNIKLKGRNFGLANPITTVIDPEYIRLVERYGGEEWENIGIAKSFLKESKVADGMRQREAGDITRLWTRAGLTDDQRAVGQRFLETAVDPSNMAVVFALGAKGAEAYKNTFAFRRAIHDDALKYGLIGEATYRKNLDKYMPTIYREWEEISAAAREIRHGTGPARAATEEITGAAARFAHKGPDVESLEKILDPRIGVYELGRAGQLIARQRLAQGLANSVIAKSTDEIAAVMDNLMSTGNVRLAMLHGIGPDKAKKLQEWRKMLHGVEREPVAERMALEVGWRRIDDMYAAKQLPEYVKSLPDELRSKWLDPTAAADVMGTMEFMSRSGWFSGFYNKTISYFRASKTAYNPATHVRNAIGAAIFHHLTTGGVPTMVPSRGIKAFLDMDPSYQAGRKLGMIGASFDAEIRGGLDAGHKSYLATRQVGQATALDWMGDSAVAQAFQRGAGYLERFYRSIDEVWKLDAFIVQTEKHKRRLTEAGELVGDKVILEKAHEFAALDVNTFTPNFMLHSDVADQLRKAVPFASFATEALRAWKNAMVQKPHLAYFWNHIVESMSSTFGAMSGFSEGQLAEAKKALPEYMQGKKTLMLPFNVDGQPRFLDMSYLIPLANVVEAERAESLFFDELVDPTQNPFLSAVAAASTKVDPFSGRKVEPSFTERQLGIPVTSPKARTLVGLAEHMATLMLPPLLPPGYAGTNLMEVARGQRNPATGEELEQGVFRTILQNVAGMRTYAPDIESQLLNIRKEQRDIGKQVSQAWARWKFARINGNVPAMEKERIRIIALKRMEGADDPEDYFAGGIERHEPFAGMSTRQMKEVLARAERLGALSPRDERIRAELISRLQSRRRRR